MTVVPDMSDAYRRCITLVRGRAQRILGDEAVAQDVAQEAFVMLLCHRRRHGMENNTTALLYRTVTNLALNRLRNRKRRRELLEAHGSAPLADRQDPADRVALRKVLALVGQEEAEIAAYYYIDGLEQNEIAKLLGIQRRTVGRRLEKFRSRARKLLGLPRELNVVGKGSKESEVANNG